MFAIERQQEILQYINEFGKADVNELSKHFKVSNVTVRRDIAQLSKKGLVIKTFGGVISVENSLTSEIPYESKSHASTNEKMMIGRKASELINDNDVIILDSGSTTFELAKSINNKRITLITNDIKIGMEAACKNEINLIIAGGIIEKSLFTLIGPTTEQFLSKVHVNKTFLGADAISLDSGITNRTMEEIPIKKAMINAAEEVIMLADSSKLRKTVFYSLCDLKCIDKLIIDKIDDKMKKALNDAGVEVIIADTK